MALFRRAGKIGDIGSSFRNSKELQKFVLTDVTPTGKSLGAGSYGSVEEVINQHLPCAGKKLHEALLDAQNEGVSEMVQKYREECQLMSSLHHPNVTQFLGICFFPGTRLPLLVMEQLETSLDDLLEHMPHLQISLKCSILKDVASGLLYLHKRNPPVIHRDLTAKNVLLTSHLAAKITDMGNSRIINMKPGRLAQTLSKLPGTLVYMPPEALDDRHSYGPPLDVFSFGHLALFTVLQIFPGDLLPSTYPNPDNPLEVRGRTELQRRGKYIDIMEAEFGRLCPTLVEIIKQCLLNAPDKRPSTDALLTRLQRMRSEIEGAQGGSPMNLDIMVRVRMAKEMKMKERQIQKLIEKKDADRNELEEKDRELEEKGRELEEKGKVLEDLRRELEERNREVEEKNEELAKVVHKETQLKKELKDKDEEIGGLRAELSKSKASSKEQSDESTNKLPVYVAKFDFKGKKNGDLTLMTGDLLYVMKVEGTEWWCAQSCKTGKTGYIPSNYVTPHKSSTEDAPVQSKQEISRTELWFTKKLGSEEHGEVWEGKWKGTTLVAIRTFKSGIVSPKLLQGVTQMSKLNHPNLVKVFGVCTKEEPIYFVTELMKKSLLVYLRGDGRALKLPQLIDIAAQVAAGMSYLEDNNITHHDLTAGNIFIGNNGVYKIAGAGLVQATMRDPDKHKFPVKWTAPEAAVYKRLSIKSDVWSFGILLTEIITNGQTPYLGMRNTQMLEAVSTGYRMPCPLVCPDKLYSIMLACWKEEPADRPTFKSLQWQLDDYFTTDDHQPN